MGSEAEWATATESSLSISPFFAHVSRHTTDPF